MRYSRSPRFKRGSENRPHPFAKSRERMRTSRRASGLELARVPDPLTFQRRMHAYSGKACFLGDADRANVLWCDLQDDVSCLCGAAKILGNEIDGASGESPSSPSGENAIRDIDLRRIAKKLQVGFDKADQLTVTASKDSEGAARTRAVPLFLKLGDGSLHRGGRTASPT